MKKNTLNKKKNQPAGKKDKKRIYLDYASMSPISTLVKKEMTKFFTRGSANPSGLHLEALNSAKLLAEARLRIAKLIFAHADEIVFTSGGTESNNLAIRGTVKSFKQKFPKIKPHIITSNFEHSSVLETCKDLEKEGIEVTYLPIDENGFISPKQVFEAIKKETVLISIMYANNEIGTIQPIAEIAKAVRRYKKINNPLQTTNYPLLHADACQAGNYLPMGVPQLGIDLMSVNGTKLYGPAGSGFLFVKRNTSILPIITGGDQEYGLRSGTESVQNAIGISFALEESIKLQKKESERLIKIRDYFFEALAKNIPNVLINGSKENRLSNNINITIDGFQSELLVLGMDARGIALSGKSSCKATDNSPSHVLSALYSASGLKMKNEIGSLRFSLGRDTKKSDVDFAVKSLKDIINLQNRFK